MHILVLRVLEVFKLGSLLLLLLALLICSKLKGSNAAGLIKTQ
jgi:hypothetical protein